MMDVHPAGQEQCDAWDRLTDEPFTDECSIIVQKLRHCSNLQLVSYSCLREVLGKEIVAARPDVVVCCLRYVAQVYGCNALGREAAIDCTDMKTTAKLTPSMVGTMQCVQGSVTRCTDKGIGLVYEKLFKCNSCGKSLRRMYSRGHLTPTASPPHCCSSYSMYLAAALTKSCQVLELLNPKTRQITVVFHFTKLQPSLGDVAKINGVCRAAQPTPEHPVYLRYKAVYYLEALHVASPHKIYSICEKKAQLLYNLAIGHGEAFLPLLLKSLAPDLAGCEVIKLGVLLCIVGGCVRANGGVRYSGNVHCLVAGGSGMGKSTLLRNVCDKLPNHEVLQRKDLGSLNASRTCQMTKGSLLCSINGGYLAVDDIHTLPPKVIPSLFEGVSADGHTVLATGASGRKADLDKRFDIVLNMVDRKDGVHDAMFSSFLLEARSSSVSQARSSQRSGSHAATSHADALCRRLALEEYDVALLSCSVVKQFIVLMKSFNPVLGAQEANLLERYCEKKASDSLKRAQLARVLCTLVQARARVDFSRSIGTRHVLDVLEMYSEATETMPPPCTARTILTLKQKTTATAKTSTYLLKELVSHSAATGTDLYKPSDIVSLAVTCGIDASCVADIIRKLNHEGVMIKSASGSYRLVRGG
eukprot:TRINITY_DN742_c0_g1_i1.p1 TRINITY_DN742_c0_g1~~TRINITY_DN742_c0_g1_i1.p1  ORF type:complete len:643 (+),score=137.39 TRINITY_DN742_c0_g1_i1:549-2477(+)